MTFGAATLQQEMEQWRTTRPDVATISLVLTDSMMTALPPRANYQAGQGSPLHISATRTGEGISIEATSYGMHEQLGTRYRTVVADTMAATTFDSTEAAATDTLAVSERKERRRKPPASVPILCAAIAGAIAAFAIDRTIHRLFIDRT